jgi:hypothetical protein
MGNMSEWHGYFAAQRLDINTNQWNRLRAILMTWGPLSDPQPARLNHRRACLDDTIVIYEAAFDTDDVSISGFRQMLAAEFGVEPGDIGVTANNITIDVMPSPFWTFDYGGANRFRVGVFAGLSSTWPQSRHEVIAYLIQHIGDWE